MRMTFTKALNTFYGWSSAKITVDLRWSGFLRLTCCVWVRLLFPGSAAERKRTATPSSFHIAARVADTMVANGREPSSRLQYNIIHKKQCFERKYTRLVEPKCLVIYTEYIHNKEPGDALHEINFHHEEKDIFGSMCTFQKSTMDLRKRQYSKRNLLMW